jgi:hypothetical protein
MVRKMLMPGYLYPGLKPSQGKRQMRWLKPPPPSVAVSTGLPPFSTNLSSLSARNF